MRASVSARARPHEVRADEARAAGDDPGAHARAPVLDVDPAADARQPVARAPEAVRPRRGDRPSRRGRPSPRRPRSAPSGGARRGGACTQSPIDASRCWRTTCSQSTPSKSAARPASRPPRAWICERLRRRRPGRSACTSTTRSKRPGETKAGRSVSGCAVEATASTLSPAIARSTNSCRKSMIGPTGRSVRRAPISAAWENSSSSKKTVSGGISASVLAQSVEQLAHLPAEVHHLDRELRHAHVQEARPRARRERLGEAASSRTPAARSGAAPRAGRCPSGRTPRATSSSRRRSAPPPAPARARRSGRCRPRAPGSPSPRARAAASWPLLRPRGSGPARSRSRGRPRPTE